MGCLCLLAPIQLYVSFAKKTYERGDILAIHRVSRAVLRWALLRFFCFEKYQAFLDGYCSTLQGLLDWCEVALDFMELSFIAFCVLRNIGGLEHVWGSFVGGICRAL